MNFPFYIARRYILSKKSKNVVNIISTVAMLGVTVGTMALVVVLSIFNGFDVLIKSFYSFFDPEIKITAIEGKQFSIDSSVFDTLREDKSVAYFCEVAEEIAHFRFEDRQYIGRIKGVENQYLEMSRLDETMYDGELMLDDENFDYAVIGRGLAYNLGVAVNFVRPIYISVPKKGKISHSTFSSPFRQKHVFLAGIYAVGQQDVDDQYALIPIAMARELLEMDSTVTSIELGLIDGVDVNRFQKRLQKRLGDAFKVENRYQQHESYYRVAKSERFFIYLTLSFIVIIASFNLASSIAMLILDKKQDINTMLSMGLTKKKVGLIFLFEGWVVSAIGAMMGLFLGVLICLGQIQYGWLKLPGNFAVDHYPVDLKISSLILVVVTVLIIGGIASWLPVKLLPKRFFQITQDDL